MFYLENPVINFNYLRASIKITEFDKNAYSKFLYSKRLKSYRGLKLKKNVSIIIEIRTIIQTVFKFELPFLKDISLAYFEVIRRNCETK